MVHNHLKTTLEVVIGQLHKLGRVKSELWCRSMKWKPVNKKQIVSDQDKKNKRSQKEWLVKEFHV